MTGSIIVQTNTSTSTAVATVLPTQQVVDAAAYALRDNVIALNSALEALHKFRLEDDEEDSTENDTAVIEQLKFVEQTARRARDLVSNREILRLASCIAEIAVRQKSPSLELDDIFLTALSNYLLEPNPQMIALHSRDVGYTVH